MSAEGSTRRGMAALVCAVLLAMACAASAQEAEDKIIDLDDIATAAGVGPIFRDTVKQIAERCGRMVPESAAQWPDDVAAWETRNAPWLTASEIMMGILLQEARDKGVDTDEVKKLLRAQIDASVAGTVGVAEKNADTCATARQRIVTGLFDISANNDVYAPEADVLLREHLPAALPTGH